MLLHFCNSLILQFKKNSIMKNSNINTKQNAVIKQTLSLEEFIKKYISSSKNEIKDFKLFSFPLKKTLKSKE